MILLGHIFCSHPPPENFMQIPLLLLYITIDIAFQFYGKKAENS